MTNSPFSNPDQDLTPSPRPRRPYRPPIGIPTRGEGRGWRSVLVSVAVHGAILLALLLPAFLTGVFDADSRSAGAEGPRGGGGGGRGLSGMPERLQYVQIAPAPAPQPQQVTVPLPPPPKVEPPPAVPPPSPTPPAAEPTAPSAGGSASGSDGTDGTGKGVGGGAGAGQGTGQGTAAGAGTGGDGNDHDPPVVTNLAILPIPVPRNVRPYRMVAYFDVDERGTAKLLSFNPSNDGGYNRRIRDMLAEIRFRPAVRRDGTAVRDTAMIVAEAP